MSSIKLTADSGGGTFEIKAPSSSSNTRVLTLPDTGNITLPTTNGITEVDHFRLSSNLTNSHGDNTITNWERLSSSIVAGLAAPHGTGMSVSSGIFTFPSTGKYVIFLIMNAQGGQNDNVQIYHKVTTNNSTYNIATGSTEGQNDASGTRMISSPSLSFIDVTDVSQVKVLFQASSIGSNSTISGGSNLATNVMFIRIADT
tara:strand:+ start:1588 stop:2190 length:603 start_codon:yes stop_codon:yes gene_type:complete